MSDLPIILLSALVFIVAIVLLALHDRRGCHRGIKGVDTNNPPKGRAPCAK